MNAPPSNPLPLDIVVNGQPRQVPEGSTLRALVEEWGADRGPVAVELNGQVVPASRHEGTALKSGDRLELVTFVGGG